MNFRTLRLFGDLSWPGEITQTRNPYFIFENNKIPKYIQEQCTICATQPLEAPKSLVPCMNEGTVLSSMKMCNSCVVQRHHNSIVLTKYPMQRQMVSSRFVSIPHLYARRNGLEVSSGC